MKLRINYKILSLTSIYIALYIKCIAMPHQQAFEIILTLTLPFLTTDFSTFEQAVVACKNSSSSYHHQHRMVDFYHRGLC
jgi:hypothetical protein